MFRIGRKAIALGVAAAVVCGAAAGVVHGQANSRAGDTLWTFLGGNPESQQYSELSQINDRNVGQLGLVWAADLPTQSGLVGNPLIRDGIIYQSAPRGVVMAHDAASGRELWVHQPDLDLSKASLTALYGTNNTRGLAIDATRIYATTGDCQVFALDRKSGKELWRAKSCDPTGDYGIIMAPRVGGGKVFIGNNNHEIGSERGFVDAFDAASGRHLWRFYTTPGDPKKPFENAQMEMAAKTWPANYWELNKGASGTVWEGMTYDPVTNLLIFGTGNPAPANPAGRGSHGGEELFVNSIIAVNATTGAYVWHFQQVPGGEDGFDSDAAAHIVLAELPLPEGRRRVVMQAAKNGYFYVLDARTGRFISANNYSGVENFNPIDPKTGRLTTKESSKYWLDAKRETIILPGGTGAHSWQLMAYNPQTGLVYIPSFQIPSIRGGSAGRRDYGMQPGDKYRYGGRLVAWDPIAQKERWGVDYPVPFNGGVLTTAGNLVIQGNPDGRFLAYAADTGKLLWRFDSKSVILGAPSTAIVNGKQMIFVPAGDGGATPCGNACIRNMTTDRTLAPSRLLAFAIGGKLTLPETAPKRLTRPILPRRPADLAAKGARIYAANSCSLCHGGGAVNAGSHKPDLRLISKERFDAMPEILQQGALRQLGMPQFEHFSDDDVRALQAYIINQAWVGWEAQQAGRSPLGFEVPRQ
ncbi:PQQ-binding-like beta-propeller repeat protein [Phenylobacterium sp.]|jgi:PQQ-dependent dehydrogenase (methanol/ethanol family)|uniref:outer membrane protein assembly factor BamB family protein n=1 Tax=Phenylobacterium sp. TaxID=1871053 RepID=UPI003784AE17